jgi:hypothetical protein
MKQFAKLIFTPTNRHCKITSLMIFLLLHLFTSGLFSQTSVFIARSTISTVAKVNSN